jgi:hypothetical protein
MTTAKEGITPTALDLLFGPDTDAARILANEIQSPQGLGRGLAQFSEVTKKAAAQQAANTVAAALQKVDLIDVLVRGWREHRKIVSAARRTLAEPGTRELVSMATHEVTLDQRPSISVLVDGQQVASLQLSLSIVFEVHALLLGISDGRLVAVHTGNCDITATLAIQGNEVLTRSGHLPLPGVVRLGQGIRLLPIGQYSPGEHAGSGHQVSQYPAEGEDPAAPWWPIARSVPSPYQGTLCAPELEKHRRMVFAFR